MDEDKSVVNSKFSESKASIEETGDKYEMPNKNNTLENKTPSGEMVLELDDKQSSTAPIYDVIDNTYYFTDPTSGKYYKFDDASNSWKEAEKSSKNTDTSLTVDGEGRQYYHAHGLYCCRDPEGNVFYLDDKNEWKPWDSLSNEQQSDNRWYFYQGDDTFYRDKESNIVYKLDKEKQDWDVYKGKVLGKRPRRPINEDEEFDTDDEVEEYEIAEDVGTIPPGYQKDPNIHYDGNMYTKVDPQDKMTYEWDANRRGWFPKLDEDFMATYQLSYGFNPDGTKNENPLKYDDYEEDDDNDEALKVKEQEKKTKEEKKKPGWFEIEDAYNTKVYVSNLPIAMDEQGFIDLMQKCGLVLKNTETGKYNIKMYTDKEGNFKGDALCTYIKIESVELALQILDGYQVGSSIVHVERAKFTQKGAYDPSLKPKKKQKKELEKYQKRQEKLFDWHPEPMRGQRAKHENVVIIRNVFDPGEFESSAERILIHKEALSTQCGNFGEVKKVELFDRNPEGVLKVTFKDVEAADMCAATLNNRMYLKRQLTVATWDGKETFNTEETEEQRAQRLKKWNEYLEGKKKADDAT